MDDNKFFPTPSRAIHDHELTDGQFRTFGAILNLCWRPDKQRFEWTDVLTMNQVAELTNRTRRTLARHIPVLVDFGYIDMHEYNQGIFALAPSTNYTHLGHARPNLVTHVPTTTNIHIPQLKRDSLQLKTESFNKIHHSKRVVVRPKIANSTYPGHASPKNEDLANFLRERGVGDPAQSRLASDPTISLQYAREWFSFHGLLNEPKAHTIRAMLDHLPVPRYCSRCGGENYEHLNDCSAKYRSREDQVFGGGAEVREERS